MSDEYMAELYKGLSDRIDEIRRQMREDGKNFASVHVDELLALTMNNGNTANLDLSKEANGLGDWPPAVYEKLQEAYQYGMHLINQPDPIKRPGP